MNIEAFAEYDLNQRDRSPMPTTEVLESYRRPVLEQCRRNRSVLPAFPATATRAVELLLNPSVKLTDLLAVISHDPMTSTQVLRVANSSLYSRGRPVDSVRDAVVRIGFNEVVNIVTLSTTRTVLDMRARGGFPQAGTVWEHLWQHAVISAYGATWLLEQRRSPNKSSAFLAGLLHDIGKTVALVGLTDLVARGQLAAPTTPLLYALLEETHVDVGGEVAIYWELPYWVTEVCVQHHGDAIAMSEERENDIVHAVRVVSGLNELRANPFHRPQLQPEIESSLHSLELNENDAVEIVARLRELEGRCLELFMG